MSATAFRSALALILLFSLATTAAHAQDGEKKMSVADHYHALAAAGDHTGLVELWRKSPESIIPVIDADLERSLAIWEKHGDPTSKEHPGNESRQLIARALAGARAATEATGSRRVLDYVSSFAGWTAEQKKAFRGGQAAYRDARQAHSKGDLDTALAKGRECRTLAEPLGDWWGTAMGLHLEGTVLQKQGEKEAAATALSRARLIYRELHLTASALRIELELSQLLLELGRTWRAKEMVRDGLATAQRIGLTPLVPQFEKLLAEFPAGAQGKQAVEEEESGD